MASASSPTSDLAVYFPAPASSLAEPPPAASATETVDLSAGPAICEDPVPAGGGGGAAAGAAAGAATTAGFFIGKKAERKKVNVAEQHGSRTSVIWRFFTKFFPPLDDGKNVKCALKMDNGKDCKSVYKHDNEGNTGTGSMIKHLRRCKDESHQQAAKEFDAESRNSSATKGARGAALSEAGQGADIFGQASRKPMSREQKLRLHRKLVVWCVGDGRPWTAIEDIGFKLIIAEWDAMFAATTPSYETLDKILREMFGTAKAELVGILQSARAEYKSKGYEGPFCSLQLDLTSKSNVEYIAASVQLIRPGEKIPTRLSVAMKAFPGRHTQIEIKHCIEDVTEGCFGQGVQPKDVFISATVDQGMNVVNACRNLGIQTILCRGHRLNSSVMWALGVNGNAKTGKNATMKALVGKCAALVGVFSHSAVNNDALRAIQTAALEKANELDDLLLDADRLEVESAQQSDPVKTSAPLNTVRRNDTRWSSTLAMMKRLVTLMDPINEYLRRTPAMAHRGLSPEEWLIVTEVCGVLELMKYVNTAIQGGADGFIGRSIFLCTTLLDLLDGDTIKITDHRVTGATAVDKPVGDLHDTTVMVMEVAIAELKERKVHIPEWDVELVGMFLDPRYKALDSNDCGGGDHTERLAVALAKLRECPKDRSATIFPSPTQAEAELAATATPPAKRPAETDLDPFAEHSRKREKRAAAAAAAASAPCTAASRFDKEVEEYKALPEVSGSKFDLLAFWDDAARPRLDEDGNTRELPRFPILAMFARVFLSADTTSCQSERDFSALAFCMNNLRLSMRQDRVEMMMFLKLNSGMIPEIRSYTEKVALMQAVQLNGFDKAVRAQADGAGEELIVVMD